MLFVSYPALDRYRSAQRGTHLAVIHIDKTLDDLIQEQMKWLKSNPMAEEAHIVIDDSRVQIVDAIEYQKLRPDSAPQLKFTGFWFDPGEPEAAWTKPVRHYSENPYNVRLRLYASKAFGLELVSFQYSLNETHEWQVRSIPKKALDDYAKEYL
jgi:hypothetical protein